MENTTSIRNDLPASLHKAVVQGDSPGARTARAALDGMYLAQGKLIDMSKQVADKDLVARTATPIVAGAVKRSDVAIVSLGEQIQHLDATIDAKLTAGRQPARGPEIRAYFRDQESSFIKLGSIFQNAAEHRTAVAEVLLGEHFLSGIKPEQKAALRSVAADVLAPDEVSQRKETAKALGLLTKASAKFATDVGVMIRDMQSNDAAAIEAITQRGDG